jgi:subtilisin family serine protease
VWQVDHPGPVTPGVWTTDWSGERGYNRGGNTAAGDAAGHYTNSFGGTSSAAPGVAGVAALILAAAPGLRHDEVKDLIRRACDRIDAANGRYDARTGHSPLYGYGRVNAHTAVTLARAAAGPQGPRPARGTGTPQPAGDAPTRRRASARRRRSR